MLSLRKQVYDYISNKYDAQPEYLWFKFPQYAVFRQKQNNKWFGIIMNVQKNKLGLKGEDEVDILNVKCNPFLLDELLCKKGILPAYHLSKGSWVSILLDGSCNFSDIKSLIDESYNLTLNKDIQLKIRNYNLNWIVPANLKYYDVVGEFKKNKTILWKQSSSIIPGDIVYIYVAKPYSAVLFKCIVLKVNIPYEFKNKDVKMERVMQIELLKEYNKDQFTLEFLKEYGITTIRGPRKVPNSLVNILN